jgi:hypothetical protein
MIAAAGTPEPVCSREILTEAAMKIALCAVVAVLAIATGTCAHAAAISSSLGAIQPYTGLYSDPNQSGSGLSVDIGPGGMLFVQFATYDAAGNQVNYLAQPTYVPSSETVLTTTGVIGTATSQMYQVTNGQCPGCPYRAPTVTGLPINPTFTWATPRHVTMSFNGSTYDLFALNYEGRDDEEFLPGTWALSFVNDDSVYPGATSNGTLATELAIVQIASAPFTVAQLSRDPASSADVQLPPADAHLYTVQCAGTQSGADDAACNSFELILTNAVPGSQRQAIPRGTAKALVWYDPATASAGFDVYQQPATGIVIGPANFHGRVYITPNTLQTHLQAQGPPHVAAVIDGTVGAALTFARLPAAAVRDCYDYPATKPCQ